MPPKPRRTKAVKEREAKRAELVMKLEEIRDQIDALLDLIYDGAPQPTPGQPQRAKLIGNT